MPYCEKCGQHTRKLANCKGCRYLASVEAARTRPENYYTQRSSAASSGGDRDLWTPPEEPEDEWSPPGTPRGSGSAAASSGSRLAEPARKKRKRPEYLASPLITDKIKTALLEGDIEADASLGTFYTWNGYTYREKVRKTSGVNAAHSMESIYEYVATTGSVAALQQADEVPYERIDDYVNTLRQSCDEGTGAFKWPSTRFSFIRAFSVALHHLPTGHMVTIKNAQPLPAKFFDLNGKLLENVSDLYHGTSPSMVPSIMGRGLLPTVGAGSDQLKEQYGLIVPGVYVSKSWKHSSSYPIHPTTDPIKECWTGVGGGTLIALDGTPPLRVTVRCLANTSCQLWHRGSSQSLYMPSDLHITHISFYAVHPKLVHKFHKNLRLSSFPVEEDFDFFTEETENEFTSTSDLIKDKVDRMIIALNSDQEIHRPLSPKMRCLVISAPRDGGDVMKDITAKYDRAIAYEGGGQLAETSSAIAVKMLFTHWHKRRSGHVRIGTLTNFEPLPRINRMLDSDYMGVPLK